MDFSGSLWKSEVASWVGHACRHEENPVFQFLQVVSKRRATSQKWYSIGAPLIIGLLPVLVWGGYFAYDYFLIGYITNKSEVSEFLKYAPLVFLGISYVSWAAIALNLVILDAMSLLRQSTKQSARFELDDLACVTSITDREIVAGFLVHALPGLYLRIIAGVGLGWLVMLLFATEWFSSSSHDTWTMVALAPISIGLWSASGCVGVTALIAFYLALGGGRSTIPAAISSLVMVGTQGMWLLMSAALATFISEEPFGSMDNFVEMSTSIASSLLFPILIVLLIVLGLRFAFFFPVLKPVQAMGSPLLLPFLALIGVSLLVANFFPYTGDEVLLICFFNYIWHFGDMLPLNFAILTDPAFFQGDLLATRVGPLNLWYRPMTIAMTQLVLLYICLGYAK